MGGHGFSIIIFIIVQCIMHRYTANVAYATGLYACVGITMCLFLTL